MDKKLESVLESVNLLEEDSNNFGIRAIDTIHRNEYLQDPTDNFAKLRQFLEDTIDFLKVKIDYSEKYPEIFHENVALSRYYEREVFQQILSLLENPNQSLID